MSTALPPPLLRIEYEEAREAYLRSLPPEHFMEATAQGTQREITLESLTLVKARRSDVHLFNELLVQYPRKRSRRLGQVVPDNMVVLSQEPIRARGSFDVPLQPAGPFWMLEYVSKYNKRKDYKDNFRHYEQELRVPYYLLFYPDDQELTLYRHTGRKYVPVKPNKHQRYEIPELEIEVGLVDEWVRFWYRGELLPLPGDLQKALEDARHQADTERRRADQEKRRAEQEKQRAEHLENLLEQERKAREALQRELEQLRARSDR